MNQEVLVFLTSVLMAVLAGLIGPFVLLRRLSFLAETLAHGSIAGIGLGMFFHIEPSATLIPFAVLLALGLTWISRNREESLPSLTAMAFAGCVGVGVILMQQSTLADPHEIVHVLFGDHKKVGGLDLALLLGLGFPGVLWILLRRRALILTFLDETLATAAGHPTGKLQYGFMISTAIVIALSLKVVGVVLVMALITIPALIAGRLGRSMNQQILLSPLIAFICVLVGLVLSRATQLPSGATIATLCSFWYLLSLFLIPASRRS